MESRRLEIRKKCSKHAVDLPSDRTRAPDIITFRQVFLPCFRSWILTTGPTDGKIGQLKITSNLVSISCNLSFVAIL